MLLTNNLRKRIELEKLKLKVDDCIPVIINTSSELCKKYIQAKAIRMGHNIPIINKNVYQQAGKNYETGNELYFYDPED